MSPTSIGERVLRAACRGVQGGDVRAIDVLEARPQVVDGRAQLGGQLGLGRRRAEAGEEGVTGPLDPPALTPDRARRPVLLAQLVDEGAGDACPGVLLEARTLGRVETVDRLDQRDEAGRRKVVELAVRRKLANLARRDVANHRRVRKDELIARAGIPLFLPAAPEAFGLGRGETLSAGGGSRAGESR